MSTLRDLLAERDRLWTVYHEVEQRLDPACSLVPVPPEVLAAKRAYIQASQQVMGHPVVTATSALGGTAYITVDSLDALIAAVEAERITCER